MLPHRGDCGLPETDSAVPWWNNVIYPNLQAFRFQKTLHVAEESLVLNNAAGEHNRRGSTLPAESCNCAVEPLGNSALKCTGNFTSIPAAEPVANHAREQRTKIQLAVREWEGICVGG